MTNVFQNSFILLPRVQMVGNEKCQGKYFIQMTIEYS